MNLKIKILKLIYSKCPKCGGETKKVKHTKCLLGKEVEILRCKECGWTKKWKTTLGQFPMAQKDSQNIRYVCLVILKKRKLKKQIKNR